MKNLAALGSSIFDELIVTVVRIGVDKTIKTLQDARSNILILSDINIDNIINAVTEITGVQKERILHGTDRSDERKMAISLCIFFIKNEFGYSYSDLKKIFNKDEAALYRYHQTIDNLPEKPKTEFDKKLTEYSKKLELSIIREKLK
jgi:hypothetical protein